MSTCYISSGIELGCSDGIGSVKKIYIVGGATGDVTGYTYNADGAITGATSSTGTTLYGFNLKRNTSDYTQNIQKDYVNGSIFYNQVLNAVFYKYDQDKRNQLLTLSHNDQIQIIVVDQNGTQYLMGQENGSYLSGGATTTGTQFADRNGMNLTFTADEKEPSRVIIGSLASVFTGATIVE